MYRQGLILCFLAFAVAVRGYPQRVSGYFPGNQRAFFINPYDGYPFEPRQSRNAEDSGETGLEPASAGESDYVPSEVNPYFYTADFADIMTQMQEMMTRLRQELSDVLKKFPESSENGSDEYKPFFSLDTGSFDLGDVQNKSSSRTEVIDGKVYVVNETVVRSGDSGNGAVLRVKTISLKPNSDSDVNTESEVTPTAVVPTINRTAAPESNESKNTNEDNNEIPVDSKVGSEVEDLNKE